MKFILSRTDDCRHHTKRWIVRYGLLFWLVTRVGCVALLLACGAVYEHFGINAGQLTKFAGDPSTLRNMYPVAYAAWLLAVVAPLLEECIFRLGLSFKKWQIAAGVAAIPLYIMFQRISILTLVSAMLPAGAAIAIFVVIYFTTTQSLWSRMKTRWYRPMIWISSSAFGFMHLVAFTNFSLSLFPYMLCIIAMPFFGGCAIAYYRVNLGFWWGVALHVFSNLPAIAMLILI